MRALVVGASGGLGSAFVAELVADPRYTQVIVWSRSASIVVRREDRLARRRPARRGYDRGGGHQPWRGRSRNRRDGAAARWGSQAREVVAFAHTKRHDPLLRDQHHRSGLDSKTRPASLAPRPTRRVRSAVGARRQHKRQSAGRLVQLSRFESRAESADPVLQYRVVVQAAESNLRRPAPGHGRYGLVEALPRRVCQTTSCSRQSSPRVVSFVCWMV